jgi:hypothetical protein
MFLQESAQEIFDLAVWCCRALAAAVGRALHIISASDAHIFILRYICERG